MIDLKWLGRRICDGDTADSISIAIAYIALAVIYAIDIYNGTGV